MLANENSGLRHCPSAQPDMLGATLIGVLQQTEDGSRISYLAHPVPLTDDLLAKSAPLHPTEVLRLAAPCEEMACRHFDGASCQLATRIVQILPAVVDTLPPCSIRPTCRWFRQEGRPSCFRCPQILTHVANPSEELRRAATPE